MEKCSVHLFHAQPLQGGEEGVSYTSMFLETDKITALFNMCMQPSSLYSHWNMLYLALFQNLASCLPIASIFGRSQHEGSKIMLSFKIPGFGCPTLKY